MNQITEKIYQHVCQLDPDQKEFQQAVYTFLLSMDKIVDELPEVTYHKVIERMVEPERVIIFRVPWIDDEGQLQINRGFRVQQSSSSLPSNRFSRTVSQAFRWAAAKAAATSIRRERVTQR